MDWPKLLELLLTPKDYIKKHPYILGFLAIVLLIIYVVINEQRHKLSEDMIHSLKTDAEKNLHLTKIIQAQVGALKTGLTGLPSAVSSVRAVFAEVEQARVVKMAMRGQLHNSLKALEDQVDIIKLAVARVDAMSQSLDIYQKGIQSEEGGRYKEAAEYYQKAAEAGVAEAQFRLGRLYFGGKGVEQDTNRATALYEQAALMGMQDAKDALADIYYNGHGVERDLSKAMAVLSLLPQSQQQRVWARLIYTRLSQGESQRATKLADEYSALQKDKVVTASAERPSPILH